MNVSSRLLVTREYRFSNFRQDCVTDCMLLQQQRAQQCGCTRPNPPNVCSLEWMPPNPFVRTRLMTHYFATV